MSNKKECQRKGLGEFINDKVLKFDSFGEAIKLNYKGNEKINSISGAFFTLAVFIIIMVYGVKKY